MTLERAREILGSAYDVLSDEQIIKMIELFESISLVLIEKETSNY